MTQARALYAESGGGEGGEPTAAHVAQRLQPSSACVELLVGPPVSACFVLAGAWLCMQPSSPTPGLIRPDAPKLAGVVVALEPHMADVGVLHSLLCPHTPTHKRTAPSSTGGGGYWSDRSFGSVASWRTVVMEGDLGRDEDSTGVKVRVQN